MIGDVGELYARRPKSDESGSGHPWEDQSPKDHLQIDPPPQSPDKPQPDNDADRPAE